jgi:hypothetical protein
MSEMDEIAAKMAELNKMNAKVSVKEKPEKPK